MSDLSDYPDVGDAYDAYVASQSTEPKDATQLIRWSKRYTGTTLVYSNVNKFLRLKRGKPAETRKARPPKQRSSPRRIPQTRSRPQSVVLKNGRSETTSNSMFNQPTRDRGFTVPAQRRVIRPKSPVVRQEDQQQDRPKRIGDITPQATEVKEEEPVVVEEARSPGGMLEAASSGAVPEKRKSVQMNRAEDQAVSRLMSAIKTHTFAIQKLDSNATEVRNEAQSLRREIEDTFESIRSSFELAKAQLMKNLTLAESDAVTKVQAEVGSTKESAGMLLRCHKQVTAPLSEAVDDDERRERAQFVVSAITEALTEAPSSMYEHHLLFQTEDVNFEELFANYGKIIIQRRKIRANAATE